MRETAEARPGLAWRELSGNVLREDSHAPCSLDGLCCWCQAACVPGSDHALSEDEAEVSPSQRTAELVDGAH